MSLEEGGDSKVKRGTRRLRGTVGWAAPTDESEQVARAREDEPSLAGWTTLADACSRHLRGCRISGSWNRKGAEKPPVTSHQENAQLMGAAHPTCRRFCRPLRAGEPTLRARRPACGRQAALPGIGVPRHTNKKSLRPLRFERFCEFRGQSIQFRTSELRHPREFVSLSTASGPVLLSFDSLSI